MKENIIIIITTLLSVSLQGQTIGNGLVDVEGNEYLTVIIGEQEWMASNLRTTLFNNGDTIENIQNNILWEDSETGAWSSYNNDLTNDSVYGKLYNWFTINDSRQLCPNGWRVPSDEDFESLVNYLGGTWEAGGKLKKIGITHWNLPNNGATDEFGFSALPGGSRENGEFEGMGEYGYFWSTWANHPTTRHRWELRHSQTLFAEFSISRNDGYNCRCIKSTDNELNEIEKTEILVFPNPFLTELYIDIPENKIGSEYKIVDSIGRIIITGTLSVLRNKVNVNYLSNGIYFFQVEETIVKLIKE